MVWAKLDGVIRGFIVEDGDEGFSAPEMKGKHSLKASVTSELVFQDCKIPKDRILPGVKGLRGPFSCLNNARYGISWGAVGAAQACFDSAKEYSLSRIQFTHPIASYQLVQNKLAWMLREITKAQLLAYHLGQKKDAGTWIPEHISLAKMNNVDIALEIAREARDIHGANGILDEYCIMRHMANLESVKTYEGTHDIHNLILGRHITGIQAFTRELYMHFQTPRVSSLIFIDEVLVEGTSKGNHMTIAVLLKQVPDTTAKISVNGGRVDENEVSKWSFSPYDEYALEAALQLKESAGGEIVAITAGPARCEKLLRDAAAVGADTLVHVSAENINDFDSCLLYTSPSPRD